jgi:microcystin-dependent protein
MQHLFRKLTFMKTFLSIFFALCLSLGISAQTPQKISYQASVRDSVGKPIAEKNVAARTSIINFDNAGDTAIYAETHNLTTDKNGLISFEIGGGTVIKGLFSSIDWAKPYVLKIEVDPTGAGTNFPISNINGLLNVPYALHAAKVETVVSNTPENGDLYTFDGSNWVARKLAYTQSVGSGYAHNNMQPFLSINYSIALTGIYPQRSSNEPFIGEVIMTAFNFNPMNFAFCNGQLLPISQNTALFSLLGTAFGGDGRSNFALPNLAGRVPIGNGAGPGLTLRIVGESVGENEVTLIPATMPAHTHAVTKVTYE